MTQTFFDKMTRLIKNLNFERNKKKIKKSL